MISDFPHRIEIGNDTTQILPLLEQVVEEGESMGAVAEDDRCRVLIALVEALTNAIVHGNLEVSSDLRELDSSSYRLTIETRRRTNPYRDRKVEIKYKFTSDRAIFQITDEGPGFDFSRLPDPTRAENLQRVSGRGIAIMRSFLDEVQFNEDGNRVTLIKYANCIDEADRECQETYVAVPHPGIGSSRLSWVRKSGI